MTRPIKVVKSARGFPWVTDEQGNRLNSASIKEVHFYPDDQTFQLTYFEQENNSEIEITLHSPEFALSFEVPDALYASITGDDYMDEEEEE